MGKYRVNLDAITQPASGSTCLKRRKHEPQAVRSTPSKQKNDMMVKAQKSMNFCFSRKEKQKMKKNLIYCVSAAILAMVFMLAGQANAQTDCTVDLRGNHLDIQCGASDDVIEVFAELNDARELIALVDIGDGKGPVDYGPINNYNITIRTGSGSDDVSVHDTAGRFPFHAQVNLVVVTGGGPDKVSVGPNVSTLILGIDTGQGRDTVLLGLNVSGYDVQVFTRGGPDVVRTFAAVPMGISGVVATENIIIRGGGVPGVVDAIVIGESSLFAGNRVRLSGFEQFGEQGIEGD
jgi:hypothetical protein